MKILLTNIEEILSDKFSLIQKGILITILLLREKDSKLTLAKCKSKMNFSSIKQELISLQKAGAIEWSGYKDALKSLETRIFHPELIEAVEFMNNLYGRNFDYKKSSTSTELIQRLRENGLEKVKLVISNRWMEWKDDSTMSKFLQPTTIFRLSKFDKYLEEASRTHKGESLLEASKINLKDGDEITLEISKTLIDTELYSLSEVTLNELGEELPNSRVKTTVSGKDIKRVLRIQENNISNGGYKEFKLIYKNN